jgi:hypothetical protein
MYGSKSPRIGEFQGQQHWEGSKKNVELRLIYSGLPLHHLLGFVKFT